MQRPILATLFVLLVLACNLSTPPTPDNAAIFTRVARDVAATLTSVPTATPPPPTDSPEQSPLPATPVPPQPTATSVPPSVTPTIAPAPSTYVVEEERAIGQYILRLWRNEAGDGWGFDNIATISVGEETLVEIEWASGFADVTGRDITGEGNPDVVVETFSGGAHCCFSAIAYDLGPALTKVMETVPSNCGGRFEDLDGDGAFEFVTCDDLFAYAYCAYAASPMVNVILRYEPSRGYVPASPRFAHLYADQIVMHTQTAEDVAPGEYGEWDETNKCAVLPVVLDHLYTGAADRAWEELNRLYVFPDVVLFWTELVKTVAGSSLFVSAGPTPDVGLPAHYMLQLLTSCGQQWPYVGLLQGGQPACDATVPTRDIFWLEAQLRNTDLLAEGERIELTPEGCTVDCRLDVIQVSNGVRLGSIRLDTTSGFPGQVYRVNGVESAHWRLRGDLTWEQAAP